MAKELYLGRDVETKGKTVKLIGITHGSAGVSVGPRKSQAIRKCALNNPKAALYSELVKTSFLPKELLLRALPLENQDERRAAQIRSDYLFGPARRTKRMRQIISVIYYIKDAVGMPDRYLDTGKTKARREERRAFHEPGVRGRLFNSVLDVASNYLVIYRSAKFAEKLANSPHTEIIAVMGADHVPLVKKFLENEKLRKRYLQQAECKIHNRAV